MSEWTKAVDVVAQVISEEGGEPGSSLHSWRCEYPDRYGECSCVAETAEEIVKALRTAGLLAVSELPIPADDDAPCPRCGCPTACPEGRMEALSAELADAREQAEMWLRLHYEATEMSREYQARAEGAEAVVVALAAQLDALRAECDRAWDVAVEERLRRLEALLRFPATFEGTRWVSAAALRGLIDSTAWATVQPGTVDQVAAILRVHYDHPDGEGSVECVCGGYEGPGDIFDHQAERIIAALGITVADAPAAEPVDPPRKGDGPCNIVPPHGPHRWGDRDVTNLPWACPGVAPAADDEGGQER